MRSRLLPALLPALALASLAHGQMTFTDVTLERGLTLEMAPPAAGIAVGDIDGDGWLDVAVFGAAAPGPRIFLNRGADVTAGVDVPWFEDVTQRVMPGKASPSSAGAFADLDGDGDQDLIVVRRYHDPLTGAPDPFDTGLEFYENVGGRFERGTLEPFLGRAPRRHGGLALADTDLDGDLDLVFVHNGSPETLVGGPGSYVRNDGFPNMVDITPSFGADLGGENRYFTAVLADFNGDMLPDLHVAVDFYADFHCRNIGGGVFQDVSISAGTTNKGADMGLAVGDIENDGDLDIYSTNINFGVLYVNDGTGTFKNEAFTRGVGGWGLDTTIGWGTCFDDFDLDGDQDLAFVAVGQAFGHLYENDGKGYFGDVTAGSGMQLRGFGLIPFDYDHDGDRDLLISRLGELVLYENQATDRTNRHWLVIELEGTQSNRDGIGARIELITPDGARQMRQILSGYSYQCGPPKDAHFGLGLSTRVKQLVVHWPSGKVTSLGPFVADRYMTIVE
ncbi:MAG: CRTAC1 family protein [Planctomycetota bacterium]